jgi:hypothetical protein
VTIAVAVGAPGKEPEEGKPPSSEGVPPESVVIASAVATIPPARQRPAAHDEAQKQT